MSAKLGTYFATGRLADGLVLALLVGDDAERAQIDEILLASRGTLHPDKVR